MTVKKTQTPVPINCDRVRFSRGRNEILHGVDFSVEPGQIVGLLGKNGAGKSTTINLLMGYLKPDSGQCYVYGEPSYALSAATRRRIGLLHEGFIQYNFMTIREIERYYREFYQTWDSRLFWQVIDRMGVSIEKRVGQLSCGQRSQVTLGLLMAQRAQLLILDDYSLGLDVGYRRLFLTFLRRYVNEYGATVLLTSHVVSELEGFIDRIIVIQTGTVLCNQPLNEFREAIHAYVMPSVEVLDLCLSLGDEILNVDRDDVSLTCFTRLDLDTLKAHLRANGVTDDELTAIKAVEPSFEDQFVGLTGCY